MIRNTHYFSVNRTMWNQIKFSDIREIRNRMANENNFDMPQQPDHVVAKMAEKELTLFDA